MDEYMYIFPGPYPSLGVVVLKDLVGLPNLSAAYGWWNFANGIGSAIGAPVSGICIKSVCFEKKMQLQQAFN